MPSVSTIQAYVKLTRPQNASGSVLTYCIGYFLVARKLSYDFFIGLLVLLALHSLATVQNDIEDFDIDRANNRRSILQKGSLTIHGAKFFVQALAFISLVFALFSPHRRLHLVAVVGLLVIAWLYNVNPVRASKKPLLSITTMGVCYGVLPFIYGYFVAGGSITANYFFAFVVFFFLARVSTAIMKDYKDAAGDEAFHKDTFYLHYGRNATGWISILTSMIAYIGLLGLLLALRPKTTSLFVCLVLVALLAVRNVMQKLPLVKIRSEDKLNSIFHKSVLNHNQFEAAVLLCLVLFSK